MDLWLVRTVKNMVAGPYTRDQLKKMVLEGQLGPQDEICQANEYWFFLYETDEVKRQLGIDVPRTPYGLGEDEDATETSTEMIMETETPTPVANERGDVPELSEPAEGVQEEATVMANRAFREIRPKKKKGAAAGGRAAVVAAAAKEAASEEAKAEAEAAESKTTEPAAEPESAPEPKPKPTPVQIYRQSNQSMYRPIILGRIEPTSVWRGFAWGLVVVSLFLIGAVVFMLKIGRIG